MPSRSRDDYCAESRDVVRQIAPTHGQACAHTLDRSHDLCILRPERREGT